MTTVALSHVPGPRNECAVMTFQTIEVIFHVSTTCLSIDFPMIAHASQTLDLFCGTEFTFQSYPLKGLGHAILGNFSTDQMVIELTKV